MKHFVAALTTFPIAALMAAALAQDKPAGGKPALEGPAALDPDKVKLAPATATQPGAPAKAEPDPTLELLKKLKPEQLEKVRRNVNEASTLVSGIRLQEALQRLDEAEQIVPDLFMVHNLKGAVFTKMRLFDKARESFQRAAKLNPASFHPKFNLAEIDFVQGQWEKAMREFDTLIKGNADAGTKKLMQFKTVICLLKLNKVEDARKLAKSFSYIDDDPVYHMSHAAIEFHLGNKEEAQTWLDSTSRIYAQQQITIYMDSFIEVGWIESLAL